MEGRSATIRPVDVGLQVDVDATVSPAARGRPALFGDRDVAPVSQADAQRLDALLRRAFAGAGDEIRLPAIAFDGTTPEPVYPRAGRGFDADQSAQEARQGWLRGRPVCRAGGRGAAGDDERRR
jgi:hypothetical protein